MSSHPDWNHRRTLIEKLAGSLMLLSFGLALLAYLIAIDRPGWFGLRPASGTAAAMSHAARGQTAETDIDRDAGREPDANSVARQDARMH